MIKEHIQESIRVKESLLSNDDIIKQIDMVVNKCVDCFKKGGKVLIAGNGGSAADAQHIAGEFISRFNFDRPSLPSIALTTDTSILTAIGNDYGYDKLFQRQIEGLGNVNDIFIGISTSGNSRNVINGLVSAKQKEMFTVGFTGDGGGEMDEVCDLCIKVPSNVTPRIQEVHILIGHIICGEVERIIFGENK